MKRYFLLFIGCLLIFFSCKETSAPKANYYYDLKKFFELEIVRLNNHKASVAKEVILNGNKEFKKLVIEKWQNEFHAFTEVDINKPAFIGMYKADTMWQKNKVYILSYKAIDKDLKVQQLSIEFDTLQNQPKKIEVLTLTNNTLYQSNQMLMYKVNERYSVKGTQKIKFLSPDSFEVNGIFKN